jgi:hypothetical protein
VSTFLHRLKLPPIVVSFDPIPDYRPGQSQSDTDLQREISDRNARISDALRAEELALEDRDLSILQALPSVVLGPAQKKMDKQRLDGAIEAEGWIPCIRLFVRDMGWRRGIIYALSFAGSMYFPRMVKWVARSQKRAN